MISKSKRFQFTLHDKRTISLRKENDPSVPYYIKKFTLYDERTIPFKELIMSSPPHEISPSSIKSINGKEEQNTFENVCKSKARFRMVVMGNS